MIKSSYSIYDNYTTLLIIQYSNTKDETISRYKIITKNANNSAYIINHYLYNKCCGVEVLNYFIKFSFYSLPPLLCYLMFSVSDAKQLRFLQDPQHDIAKK